MTTRTNETGVFVFPAVPVGSYSLKVAKEGFKAYELSDFRVTVGQRAMQDVELELGPVTESMTIEAAGSAPPLEPSSNELGTLIEPVNVQQLPLNGRNYLQLGYLSGAAQDGGTTTSDFLSVQTGHADRAITIAGTEQDLVGFTVNGISVAGSRNVIPPSRLNPIAQKLLSYYLPGSNYNMRPLNVFGQPVQTQNSDQGGLRLDANLGKNHALFGQYMRKESPVENPALLPVSGLFYHLNTQFAMVQLSKYPLAEPRAL